MTSTSKIALMILPLAMTGWLLGQGRMRAGLWENTVIAGGQTVTHNACITAEQEQKSNTTVEVMRESTEKALAKTGTCKLKEYTISGGVQTVIMVCGKNTNKNVTAFRADSFETTATSTTPEGVKTSLMKGRRLGDCPAGGAK
jgi:hypothetical protein